MVGNPSRPVRKCWSIVPAKYRATSLSVWSECKHRNAEAHVKPWCATLYFFNVSDLNSDSGECFCSLAIACIAMRCHRVLYGRNFFFFSIVTSSFSLIFVLAGVTFTLIFILSPSLVINKLLPPSYYIRNRYTGVDRSRSTSIHLCIFNSMKVIAAWIAGGNPPCGVRGKLPFRVHESNKRR